ncbi:hypothetical protein [Dactylosporangium matsuzakiense]|nr:hypothetical protein [Dactylosporangium matsuzakiense]UWZ46122.1 hypothetical protein Dmats_06620 [Dactylosporangium matsuzakiense]
MADADGRLAGQFEELRKTYPHAYQPWSTEDETRLSTLFAAGSSVEELALALGRQPGSIRSRLARLGAVVPDSGAATG